VDARMRASTASIGSRSFSGFNVMNICAELRWPPPVKAPTVSTAGSLRTIATRLSTLAFIAWKEIDWSARTKPMRRPESTCGKKPFGTTV
jgi:hypothetical protein